jgi:hypothetical protein
MMMEETGERWKLTGSSKEMAAVGPNPGNTPTKVSMKTARPGFAPIPNVHAPGVYSEDKPYNHKKDAAADVVSFHSCF